MSTSTPVADNRLLARGTAPDEAFWKRYSPHHEFPLSAVTSVALHVLALVLLGLAAYFLADLIKKRNKPLDEQPLTFLPGGGGSKTGVGGGPGGEDGGGGDDDPGEDVGDQKPGKHDPEDPTRDKLAKPGDVPIKPLDQIKDPETWRWVKEGNVNVKKLEGYGQGLDKLLKGVKKGKGEGGPGRDGGKDRGKDTGTGRGEGDGDGDMKRVKRVLRWTMIFDTYSGEDYRKQLAGLGAFLAVPQPPDEQQYRVIRELTAPPRGDIEDLETISNIHWNDRKPESVAALSRALGINPIPTHIVAFFPVSLEEKLLRLELKYRGLKEEQIYETRFRIQKRGGGMYEPVVISQTPIR
jgi:hypothetical protein